MHHHTEFQAQLPDGRFVLSLGDPEIVARCAAEPLPEPHLTDGMSQTAVEMFAFGDLFNRMSRLLLSDQQLHDFESALSPALTKALTDSESRGEER